MFLYWYSLKQNMLHLTIVTKSKCEYVNNCIHFDSNDEPSNSEWKKRFLCMLRLEQKKVTMLCDSTRLWPNMNTAELCSVLVIEAMSGEDVNFHQVISWLKKHKNQWNFARGHNWRHPTMGCRLQANEQHGRSWSNRHR